MEYTIALNYVLFMLIEPGSVEWVSHSLHQQPGRVIRHLGIFVNCDDVLDLWQDRDIALDREEASFGSASEQ
jgi:hypothetical protein